MYSVYSSQSVAAVLCLTFQLSWPSAIVTKCWGPLMRISMRN